MADENGPVTFFVQQTLHGYGDGHRLLAGSASLPAQDVRTMLVLSDVSGSSTHLPKSGYLTGYPLSNSGKFVLARTWPAPEMSRPGCVWTHSLVIDFADLATLQSASDLTALFRRPHGEPSGLYEKSAEIRPSTIAQPPVVSQPSAAAALLGALYGKPRQKVVAQYSGEHDEILMLALWMQQWPRLRRSFRFCSFSAADRSTSSDVFDLQLVEKSERQRFNDSVTPSPHHLLPELTPLLDDLLFPDQSGLRTFLRNVGGDVTTGRSAMLPLNELFNALYVVDSLDLRAAIEVLDELGPSQARGARISVVDRALDEVERLDDHLFQFVIETAPSEPLLQSRLLVGSEARYGNAILLSASLRFNRAGC
jgi:hypothetical protein